jgi:hypothetical protein
LPLELCSVDEMPGMGAVGSVTRFDDWREVGGLRLPFRSSIRFSSSLLGTGEARWVGVETGIELAPDAFDPATLAPPTAR